MSVVAAGAKGSLWFQSNLAEADEKPERWEAMRTVNRMVRGVRAFLREGDATGLATSDAGTVVEAIRARDVIVVPVIDVKASAGPDALACASSSATGQLPHWKLADTEPQVSVTVPDDFEVADVFEVQAGQIAELSGYQAAGRVLTFAPLPLGNTTPARLLVLARSNDARAAVMAGMGEF